MAKKGKFDYFDAFEQQADIAAEAAQVLIESIEKFTNAEDLRPLLEKAHEIEHRGDEVNHAIRTSVSVDFITPIEREDILQLAHNLDEVTDMIEGTIQRFYMYDVQFMHDRAGEFAHIIHREIKALRLPRSVIIAMIRRGRENIVPKADVVLESGEPLIIGAEALKDDKHIDLKELVLLKQSSWNGSLIRDLDISRQTIIVMVQRQKKMLVPQNDLMLLEGDKIILYTQSRISDANLIQI